MNPGPVEEAGKAATHFIDAMSSSPTVLAMTVFNIAFLAFVLWSTMEERKWRQSVVVMMVEQQSKSAQMLSVCVPYEQLPKLIDATKRWQP